MKKIGILGGAFDPIHKGHILIGQHAYQHLGLDEVWVLPNGKPPHKSMSGDTGYIKHRVNMIERAIKGIDYFKLHTYEINSASETCYSYETMRAFKELYGECEFYFIVGRDSLMSLDKWKHPEILLKHSKLVAFNRDESPIDSMTYKASELMNDLGGTIMVIDESVVEISSTTLRNMIKEKADLSAYLECDVEEYIYENKLYL